MAKSFDELAKRTMSKESRLRAARRTKELLHEMLLRELRELTGMTQKQLADALKMKQPSLSKIENQSDIQLSTLQKIIHALGGELEVLAKFPEGKSLRISLEKRKQTRKRVVKSEL